MTSVRLATWNVNSVRKRLPQLLAWLDEIKPDIVVLRELKTETASFPRADLAAAEYTSLLVGQRTWNGVALLSRGRVRLMASPASNDPNVSQK